MGHGERTKMLAPQEEEFFKEKREKRSRGEGVPEESAMAWKGIVQCVLDSRLSSVHRKRHTQEQRFRRADVDKWD